VVEALRQLNYRIVAMGDSYNDISMLKEADEGILFCPPDRVIEEYPELPVALNYEELSRCLSSALQAG
jgi:phosphoserine/homoserine phosphotransferase